MLEILVNDFVFMIDETKICQFDETWVQHCFDFKGGSTLGLGMPLKTFQ